MSLITQQDNVPELGCLIHTFLKKLEVRKKHLSFKEYKFWKKRSTINTIAKIGRHILVSIRYKKKFFNFTFQNNELVYLKDMNIRLDEGTKRFIKKRLDLGNKCKDCIYNYEYKLNGKCNNYYEANTNMSG